MNPTDRGHWTSASNAHADALCPARFKAQQNIPEPPPSPEADRGTKIHAWLSGQINDFSDWPPSDQETAEAIRESADRILREQFPDGCTLIFERRLWGQFGMLRHSGQPDLLAKNDNRILILDYKTGFGLVPESDANRQLRDLAVLAWENFQCVPITVGKVQPTTSANATLCAYGLEDIVRAGSEMWQRIEACHQPNAPRIPGPIQCRYCRFRPQCPEANQTVTTLATVETAGKSLMDGTAIARVLDACAVAAKIIEDNLEKAKKLLAENPDAIPGWKLTQGAEVRSITDPNLVANRFVQSGGSLADFMKTIDVGLGKLREQLRGTTGLKGKGLDTALSQLISGAYEVKRKQPSLERT